jgi:hypothetical protein
VVGSYCLARELTGFPFPADWAALKEQLSRNTLAVIGVRPVQLMLAADAVKDRLSEGDLEVLRWPWPFPLVEYVAEKLVARPSLLTIVRDALIGDRRGHAIAASLVTRVDRCWRPDRKLHRSSLGGADLRGVDWSGLDLSGFDLGAANLSNAVLASAQLKQSILAVANLSGARLQGADLSDVRADAANLSRAVLDECQAS